MDCRRIPAFWAFALEKVNKSSNAPLILYKQDSRFYNSAKVTKVRSLPKCVAHTMWSALILREPNQPLLPFLNKADSCKKVSVVLLQITGKSYH